LKERQKGPEDKEEEVNSYWMTLRKREDTGYYSYRAFLVYLTSL
jgi:hypothetical protein